jgi:hypothetical protein
MVGLHWLDVGDALLAQPPERVQEPQGEVGVIWSARHRIVAVSKRPAIRSLVARAPPTKRSSTPSSVSPLPALPSPKSRRTERQRDKHEHQAPLGNTRLGACLQRGTLTSSVRQYAHSRRKAQQAR